MFEKLGNAIKKATDKIASAVTLDKKLIDSIVKDLQRALIQADVNISLVHEISQKIKKLSESKIKGIEKKEQIINTLYKELKKILGDSKKEIKLKKQTKILLLGLYGAGKTTTSAKLAAYYSKRGKKTCLVGLDVHRPAAADQLEQIAKKAKVPCFTDKKQKNPEKIYKKYKKEIEKNHLIIIDTAGRDVLDNELIKEIKSLNKQIKPDYILLIMPADIGQTAKKQASEFQKACNISGVIITRMDSSAKGGGALTACYETNAPVYFITTGEHLNDIETFNPESFISRMLGLGDLETLIEKVQNVVSEDEQLALQQRLSEGKINLKDVYDQLGAMQGIGSLSKIKSLIPGLGNAKITDEQLENQEVKLKQFKSAIDSMTQEEIENPEVLEKQTSRLRRISKGSGVTTSTIRSLIKQYKMLKEFSNQEIDMSQGISQKQLQKLAKKFGKVKKFKL